LDIGVLGYIGIVWPKEHSPEVSHIPPVTPCILHGRAVDHSPLSSAAVMEKLSYTSPHPLGHNRACNGITLPSYIHYTVNDGFVYVWTLAVLVYYEGLPPTSELTM